MAKSIQLNFTIGVIKQEVIKNHIVEPVVKAFMLIGNWIMKRSTKHGLKNTTRTTRDREIQ